MYQEAKRKAKEEAGEGGRPNRGGFGGFNTHYGMNGKEWEREAFITIFYKV